MPTALGLVWLGPVLTAVQHIGIGLGTTLIGAVSDSMRVRFGTESPRYAILAGTGFYLIAAALLFFAGRKLAKDWA